MLRFVLAANAVSCLAFGAVMAADPTHVSAVLGSAPALVVRIVGIGLLFNGLHLAWTARTAHPARRDVLYFAAGDFGWVAATIVLLALGIWITEPAGTAWAVAVAIWVGACGLAQWRLAPTA